MVLPLAGWLGLGGTELLVIAAVLVGGAFWLWMLIDCAIHEQSPIIKLGWIIVLVVLGILAAPIYFFARKLPRKKSPTNPFTTPGQ